MNIEQLIGEREEALRGRFAQIDEVALHNQEKVLRAFQTEQIAARHLYPSSGYGYGDDGRDALGRIYAHAFGAERAVVSPSLLSGTHAITVALFGILRPQNNVLCITGVPYDTLRSVIWKEGCGSLKDFGIAFDVVPLKEDGGFDEEAIRRSLHEKDYQMVYIQRSRGYELRDALSVQNDIAPVCAFVRECGFRECIFVDNCYGEFVEEEEPTAVGADLMAGSLIKNPGGGLAPTGGYIAGKEQYVLQAENRLTAPSVGAEIGSYAYGYQNFYEGFFLAPHTVAQALKGGYLIGACLEQLGCESFPAVEKRAYDITRAIRFRTEEELVGFIQSVQDCSPIDSFVHLEPSDMPGYDEKIIMAAGTFTQGATSELSADAPIKKPYTAYFQGGLTYEHCKIACKNILKRLVNS